ncbi:hypothetical protein TNIN_271451 [Trichonephila inaurata madagascariensis]|uniref:Uncharacterized protein n=1 Tax=Trichonephila inaurata madagascariensis TaxID=2747483 RepID=A0A8X6YHG3_9ARAC|nr:hypothetical protein TNIN_271451 [Trichonephila inaurata madagascariensis]
MRKNKYLIYLFSVSIQHRTSDASVRVNSAFLYISQYGDDPSPFLNREEARHKLHVCVVRLCRTSTSYDTEGPCLRVSGVLGQHQQQHHGEEEAPQHVPAHAMVCTGT